MENTVTLTRRKALGLAAAGLAAPLTLSRAQAATALVLVELFTSQGCSSCPPADRLASQLEKQQGVIVVSFNVDYWDYLGWKDTLAKPEFGKRQMDYAHARGDGNVYTPQMVFNGAAHAVGSNTSAVASAILKAQSADVNIALAIKVTDQDVIVELPKGKAGGEATLWLMAIAPSISVKIERGENAGTSAIYHSVVRKLVKAGTWNGEAAKFSVPKSVLITPDSKSCIAVLQKGYVGPVLGLASLASMGA